MLLQVSLTTEEWKTEQQLYNAVSVNSSKTSHIMVGIAETLRTSFFIAVSSDGSWNEENLMLFSTPLGVGKL